MLRTRAELESALRKLEPGGYLAIPEFVLARLFGSGALNEAAIESATALARKHKCVLDYNEFDRAGPVFKKRIEDGNYPI